MAELRVVIMRGGTSKGVFVAIDDLPADLEQRDRMILRLMGSPDPMQLDGLGGTHSSTSKVMAVGASPPGSGADVDYLFAQVAVAEAVVDLTGNCGNLTAAVAHYALQQGLAPAVAPSTVLHLRNLNTGTIVRATVEVGDGGQPAEVGGTAIDGVPGSGAPLLTEYLQPAGSVTGTLFPTGSRHEVIGGLEVSVVDVTSPHVFLRRADVGLSGSEAPAELNGRADLLARLAALRDDAGRRIGVTSLAIPRLVMVGPGCDVSVLATSMGRFHHATPITAALCTAAAARLEGTIVHEVARPTPRCAGSPEGAQVVRVEHPKGAVQATVTLDGDRVVAVGVVRTARRLLSGTAHL